MQLRPMDLQTGFNATRKMCKDSGFAPWLTAGVDGWQVRPTRLGCVLHCRACDVIKVSLKQKGARLTRSVRQAIRLQEKVVSKYQLDSALGFCGRNDQLQLILGAYAHHSQGYRRCVVEYKERQHTPNQRH